MRQFPHYFQQETTDCGPICLNIIAKHFGQEIPTRLLRDKCCVNRDGVSLSRLSRAAKSIGFESIAARISWHQLQELDSLPVILHWNQNHFVVLYKIEVYKNKHKIYISDPGVGLCEYSEQDFLKSWCNYSASDNPSNVMGVVLLLEPCDEFYSCVYDIAGRSRSNMIRYVLPHSRLLGIVSFTIIIASVFTYLLPKITSLVVDKGINNKNLSLILLLLIAQMIIVLVQLFNNMVKSWVTQKLSSQIGLSIITDFIGKLMRLPMSFFEKKKIGDIMQRNEKGDDLISHPLYFTCVPPSYHQIF